MISILAVALVAAGVVYHEERVERNSVDTQSPVSTQIPLNTTRWITYTNAQYGFSFKHPADWHILTDQNPRAILELYSSDEYAQFEACLKQTKPNETFMCGPSSANWSVVMFDDYGFDPTNAIDRLNHPGYSTVVIHGLAWIKYYPDSDPPTIGYHINVPGKNAGLEFTIYHASAEQTLLNILSTFKFTK